MEINMYMDRYKTARFNFFKWRHELDTVNKALLALTFACLTGVMAQFRFYIPGTLVPITGQTFAVLLSAVALGRWGGVSQGLYASIGAAGVPWFAGAAGGIGVLTGPTGGYIIGFVVAATFLGYYTDKYVRSRSVMSMLGLMAFANFAIIYGIGLTHLYFWNIMVMDNHLSLTGLLIMGAIPFIAGDVFKIAVAAGVGRAITPKRAYNGETDAAKWKAWPLP